jgi:NitT/TauT family transport system permease protein
MNLPVFSPIGGRRLIPSPWDIIAIILVIGTLAIVGHGAREMKASLATVEATGISLDPSHLPEYALRTVLRMVAALAASLVFTLTYATLAAKSRRAEWLLVPMLDILQSVPVLGFLTFTVAGFMSLFPGRVFGAELAAIFAIFTSQAWNMAFSFYQSLKTTPADLEEVSRGFQFSAWQRFWRLEVPYATPSLIWNMMMSMSGGWFFVVASESISVGQTSVALPGIGSYVALAIAEENLTAVLWAVGAMMVVIALYDQLLFRPLVAWADKFRFEQTAGAVTAQSWLLRGLQRSRLVSGVMTPISRLAAMSLRIHLPRRGPRPTHAVRSAAAGKVMDGLWLAAIVVLAGLAARAIADIMSDVLTWADIGDAVLGGLITLARVVVLMAVATVIWVPVGVWIGLRPVLSGRIQPLAQFLAAFPANLLFPVAVMFIVRFRLNPDIWLSPLIIMGTQWYILFNVIAGTNAFPNDLKEAAANFRLKGWLWWRTVMLPGIFPYYITGAVTASGGSWNASIVSEVVSWGGTRLEAHGLGAYIAKATAAGDQARVILGIVVMSVFVTLFNRLLWRPLYGLAQRRFRLA